MRHARVIACLVLIGVLGWVPSACAKDTDVVTMKEVDALLNKLVDRGVLKPEDIYAIKGDMAKAHETALAKATPEGWVPRTILSGDIRLRNEYRDRSASTDLNRQRIRFRLGLVSQVSNELEVGARLATGSNDNATSTNQSFDDTFEKKQFNLDQAYVKYMPALGEVDTAVIGGLMDNPFWVAGDSQLVWDDDLAFAGAASQLAYDAGAAEVFLNTGAFSVDTDGFGTDNPSLWSVQAGTTFEPFTSMQCPVLATSKVTTSLAYHDYKNTAGKSLTNDDLGSNGTGVEDFNELNPAVEFASKVVDYPLSVWWDQVMNLSEPRQENGYQFGLRLGKAKVPWSLKEGWEAGYAFQRLESNAVLDVFTNSDFGGGGTNHRGNIYWLKLATLKNSTAGFKISQTQEVIGSKNNFDTYQMDWVTKF
jgi:hypothetical protein